jgi:hypothetical protein
MRGQTRGGPGDLPRGGQGDRPHPGHLPANLAPVNLPVPLHGRQRYAQKREADRQAVAAYLKAREAALPRPVRAVWLFWILRCDGLAREGSRRIQALRPCTRFKDCLPQVQAKKCFLSLRNRSLQSSTEAYQRDLTLLRATFESLRPDH